MVGPQVSGQGDSARIRYNSQTNTNSEAPASRGLNINPDNQFVDRGGGQVRPFVGANNQGAFETRGNVQASYVLPPEMMRALIAVNADPDGPGGPGGPGDGANTNLQVGEGDNSQPGHFDVQPLPQTGIPNDNNATMADGDGADAT